MSAPLLSQPKRLHQMNRLEDVGPFPGGGLNLNSEVWILVLVLVVVLVLDQSAFSAAKRARLSRNYFVQLV
jgi:hypothetical protein